LVRRAKSAGERGRGGDALCGKRVKRLDALALPDSR
jgi:hypothetical protein